MYWSNLLHIYQPPTQTKSVVHKIAKESYGPLAIGLKKNKHAKFVLNINGSLTELLAHMGYQWILDEFRSAAERGQIEFTGSAMYHAILPLLPKEEILRQIKLNNKTNRKYFKDAWKPKGFFPPELCYSHTLGEILNELGYAWVVMDEIGYDGRFGHLRYDKIYNLKTHAPFSIFFRKRRASDFISMTDITSSNDLTQGLKSMVQEGETYIFTAMDGETYGHHHKELDEVLFDTYNQLYESKEIQPILLSELIEVIYPREEVDPRSCSWATSIQDIKNGAPFGLWRDVKNEVHNLQWALTDLAISTVYDRKKYAKGPINKSRWQKARLLLDKGLHSDQYWWASGRSSFGERKAEWLPNMITRGAQMLVQAVKLTPEPTKKHASEARRLYQLMKEKTEEWSVDPRHNRS